MCGKTMPKEAMNNIAKEHLGIHSLKTRKRDSLDFHDVPVWGVANALQDAYEKGIKDAS
jgi:hypothetical protein